MMLHEPDEHVQFTVAHPKAFELRSHGGSRKSSSQCSWQVHRPSPVTPDASLHTPLRQLHAILACVQLTVRNGTRNNNLTAIMLLPTDRPVHIRSLTTHGRSCCFRLSFLGQVAILERPDSSLSPVCD